MRIIFLLFAFTIAYTTSFSQSQIIQLDQKYLHFDNGRELPAEQTFIVKTSVINSVALLKMQISKSDFRLNRIAYESTWIRKDNDLGSEAILPNYYKLKSSEKYNYRFLYFRKIKENERRQLIEMLSLTGNSYINANILIHKNKYKFLTSPRDIFNSLNSILSDGMGNYELRRGIPKPQYSTIIENMLNVMSKNRVNSISGADSTENAISTIQKQLRNEITMFVNSYEFILDDAITIQEYPTEKTMNTLSLNLGYAGIYNNNNNGNFNYYSGPFLGLSLPLGNNKLNTNFWSKTSLSAGVFLQNFKPNNNLIVSGPLVKRPIYFGAGYKVFKFLRIQAGTTILEDQNQLTNTRLIYFKPYVGLSIELNLWLGISK